MPLTLWQLCEWLAHTANAFTFASSVRPSVSEDLKRTKLERLDGALYLEAADQLHLPYVYFGVQILQRIVGILALGEGAWLSIGLALFASYHSRLARHLIYPGSGAPSNS